MTDVQLCDYNKNHQNVYFKRGEFYGIYGLISIHVNLPQQSCYKKILKRRLGNIVNSNY